MSGVLYSVQDQEFTLVCAQTSTAIGCGMRYSPPGSAAAVMHEYLQDCMQDDEFLLGSFVDGGR